MNGLSFLSFNLKADIADELAPLDLNIDAINTDSLLKILLEIVRNCITKLLSSSNCSDAEFTILSEVSIPPPLPDEEERMRFFKPEGFSYLMSIMFRSDISPCREPDGGASHLGVEPALDIMINFLMQSESRKGFSAIKADSGNRILDIGDVDETILKYNGRKCFCSFGR